MKQEFFFYSGLPRAGGTMLASVMNQHPDLYVSPLSPTVELLYYTEKYFDEGSEAYNANPQPVAKQSVLESLPREYYKNIPKKYIMDNNRAWPNNTDRICKFITTKPKIVCIVRDVPSILASFIDLVNRSNNPGDNFIDRWLVDNRMELNTKNRCYYLMQPTGIVNQSLWSMYQGYNNPAVKSGMHMVEYDDLISKPDEIMSGIVDFLDIPSYKFVFNNIENVTPVDDVTYNLAGMHSVRPKLASRNLDPMEILGPELVRQYSDFEYWREVKKPSKIKLVSI
jgi:sulfotransferase